MNITGLQIEFWPIDQLIPYVRNARTHSPEQIAQVAASMIEFGWTNPILVGPDRVVIAGHARLLAARKLGMNEVPVIVLGHLTDAQRRALVLTDNKLALNAGWDMEMLRVELDSLEEGGFELDVIGFSDKELEEILRDPEEARPGHTDEDAAPEAPARPVSRAGDLWVLGQHLLLCGNATDADAVRRLMGDEKADLVFTDPPYNVAYIGYTDEKLKIEGDRMKPEEYFVFLHETFAAYRTVVKPGVSFYVCHPSSAQREFQDALEGSGFEVRCQIIWAKNTFAWGFGRYKFQHEPIFYCHVAGQSDAWYGDKSQSTLWQEKKPAANRLHPTMKPVELIDRALLNSSKAGDCVLDLFGGSGSTLIACERRNRNARLMELDPKYADVIVKRWQEYTGHQAVLESDDRSFDEVAAERVE